jgi:hypothetical protein
MKSLIGRLVGRSARPPYMAATSLTLLLLLISAAPAFSAGITFRNEHKIPIIVQSATVVNNMVRRGAPLLIYPGKIARELNLKAGDRVITVYDGRQPTRILYQGPPPVAFKGEDLVFRVVCPLPRNPFRVVLVHLPTP